MKLDFPLGQASCIAVVDDFLEQDFCESLVRDVRLSADKMNDGETLGGLNPDIKKSRDFVMKPDVLDDRWETFEPYDDVIAASVGEFLTGYIEACQSIPPELQFGDTGYQIQHYKTDEGFYTVHIDGAPWMETKRIAAIVAYLNDVEDGGETFFPTYDYAVKPVAGRAIMFPCGFMYPHVGRVPLSGDKWIISTFILNLGD